MTEVKVGSIWADNDPCGYGRQVRVTGVDSRYAYVRSMDVHGGWTGRQSRIQLSAMRPNSRGQRTGYHLVSKAQP